MGNPMVHWELMVTDLAKAKKFYSTVFDWAIDESPMPSYSLITTAATPAGGMMVKPDMAPMCALNTYFGVDSIEATLAKAVAAGATMMVPKTEIPGMGYWAMFMDPDGIAIGIFQGQGQ
jgi:predicted enzyme related to lactoylglutathione lyase